MYKRIIFCHVLFIIYSIFLVHTENLQKYGKFILKIEKFDICKGPKRVDCTNITSSVENETTIKMDMYIKENVTPNQGKVIAMANGSPLVRLQMKNPCEHLFMKPLFQAILNATQKCEFKKGRHILNIDIQDVAQRYYGGNFFYGNVSFKSVFYNDRCNFSCAIIYVSFIPDNWYTHGNNGSTALVNFGLSNIDFFGEDVHSK